MQMPRRIAARVKAKLRQSVMDDQKRQDILFNSVNLIMGAVSLLMSVVNIFTQKYLLLCATLLFTAACVVNAWGGHRGGRSAAVTKHCFLFEIILLCMFFCISGTPEGFSALWTCFIPSFTIMLLGMKRGSLFSILVFAMVAFLFWLPAGRALLRYEYTASFMLRFPMLYLAFYVMSFFLETVRLETQRQLKELETKYKYLYNHDALTDISNRYGFNENLAQQMNDSGEAQLALLMLDIDDFKQVNDRYGHDNGDRVLCSVAEMLRSIVDDENCVSRWGGEEFTVLLSGDVDAPALAEQIRREIEERDISLPEQTIRITVSIGVAVARDKRRFSPERLISAADDCLYEAKHSGRNRVISTEL